MTYVRWRMGEPRLGRVFPRLTEDHPSVHDACLVCVRELGTSEPVQLLVLGPSLDDREAYLAGRWFSARALIAHAECLGTREPLREAQPDTPV